VNQIARPAVLLATQSCTHIRAVIDNALSATTRPSAA
jgi:hypothetical protein